MPNSKTLTPFIFLVVAGIIFYGGVWQQVGAVQTLHAQVSKADVALKQAQGGNAEQAKLVDAWQNLSASLKDRVALGLPSGSDLPNLILLLNNEAISSGLLVENIAVAGAQKGTPTPIENSSQVVSKSVSIALTAHGDYPAVKAFVQNIQREERIMDVQAITISPFSGLPAAGSTAKLFELLVSLNAYYVQ